MIAVTLDEWKKKLESPNREVIILHNPKVRGLVISVVTGEGIPLGLFVLFPSNGFVPVAFHSPACTRGEGNGSLSANSFTFLSNTSLGKGLGAAQSGTTPCHPAAAVARAVSALGSLTGSSCSQADGSLPSRRQLRRLGLHPHGTRSAPDCEERSGEHRCRDPQW